MGRRTITETDVDPKRVLEAIGNVEHLRDKALIAMGYLLAGRISEILGLYPNHITVEGRFMVVTLHTKKKKKGILMRKLPVPLRHPLVKVFANWLPHVKSGQPIFYSFHSPNKAIDRIRAWRILKDAKADMWLHLLRHIRLSELAPKLNPFELQAFAGWSDVRPASSYVHLGWKPIAEKMEEK